MSESNIGKTITNGLNYKDLYRMGERVEGMIRRLPEARQSEAK
jgi:hypothetical protein